MRILLSAYACAPNKGSEPGIGWHWAVTLAKQGHEVHCFTNGKNQDIAKKQFSQKHSIPNLTFHFIKVAGWLELLKRLYPYPLVYLHYLVWQYKAYRYAIKQHKKLSFDLAHHVTYGSIQLGSHLWKLDMPFVYGPVGGGEKIPSYFKKYLGFGQFKEISRNLVEYSLTRVFGNVRSCLSQASMVLVTNGETHALAKRLGAANIRYFLDMGITHVTPRLPTKELSTDGTFRLLWVGKLITTKGLGLVLEGLKAANNKNISLTIVGNGPLWYYYHLKVLRLGLADQVHFKGYQTYAALKQLYASVDALVYSPLRSAFGGQLLEAMSFGLPTITLDLHGAGFFVPEDAGIKLKLAHSKCMIKAMGDAMNKLADHPDIRKHMSAHAYQFAKEHEWEQKVKNMIAIYEVVLSYPITYPAMKDECSV